MAPGDELSEICPINASLTSIVTLLFSRDNSTLAPFLFCFFVLLLCCAAQGNWFGFTGIYGTCRVFTIASMSRFSAGASDTAAFQTSRQSTAK